MKRMIRIRSSGFYRIVKLGYSIRYKNCHKYLSLAELYQFFYYIPYYIITLKKCIIDVITRGYTGSSPVSPIFISLY